MKTIGRTEEGNCIVEMTADEYREFINLENAILDGQFYFDAPRMNLRGAELSPIFKALNELVSAKQSITRLQGYINTLADYFGKIKSTEKENKDA